MNFNPNNHDIELVRPKTELLVYSRRGVLYVQGKPHYIVELTKEQGVLYAVVYRTQDGTEDNPQKRAIEHVDTSNRFSDTTLLGKLANQLFPSKKRKKWVVQDPVFIAPVLPNRPCTFTGKIEAGFFEREPDRMGTVAGERKLIRGINTGVFIGLSAIVWEDKWTISTDSLVRALTQYKQAEGFYDLTGNNKDEDNPLATYYKGGE
jgi:hypothetical protein